MQVRALCSFCIGGGVDVVRGQEFDAPDHMTRYWITIGNVELVDAAQLLPPGGLTVGTLYTQDGQPVHLDPKKASRT